MQFSFRLGNVKVITNFFCTVSEEVQKFVTFDITFPAVSSWVSRTWRKTNTGKRHICDFISSPLFEGEHFMHAQRSDCLQRGDHQLFDIDESDDIKWFCSVGPTRIYLSSWKMFVASSKGMILNFATRTAYQAHPQEHRRINDISIVWHFCG